MRKIVTISALVSGMLAGPLLAVAKPTDECADPSAVAEMQAHVDAVTGGMPLEAERMQELNRRILQRVQAQVDQMLALTRRSPLLFVDDAFASPSQPPMLAQGGRIPQPLEKAAFLGVATAPVGSTLRDQLKLQRGMGLIVEYVAADSPALQAGVQPHDVLEKLDDQWLVNGPQFAALVRAKKPGDTVLLTVIRAGERIKVTVKLTEKELPALEDEQELFHFPGAAPDLLPPPADGAATGAGGWGAWQRGSRKTIFTAPDGTITRVLKDGVHDITLSTTPQGETRLSIKDTAGHDLYAGAYMTDADKAAVPPEFAKAIQELASSNPAAVAPSNPPAESPQQSTATMVRSDAQHQLILKIDGPHKSLRVKDAATGNILFDGPVDTDEQVAALPPIIAEKMHWMEQKMGIGK